MAITCCYASSGDEALKNLDQLMKLASSVSSELEGETNEDILAVIAMILAFIVKKEEPEDGMYLLLQVISRASELAFGIKAEIVTPDQIQ